ncbi:hypothetical protein NDU88_003917, partial [Pleurodeles waltl]
RGGQGGPSSMFDRLLTSRPIRIEDGRDVRGRREGRVRKRSAKTRIGGVLAGSSWASLLVA